MSGLVIGSFVGFLVSLGMMFLANWAACRTLKDATDTMRQSTEFLAAIADHAVSIDVDHGPIAFSPEDWEAINAYQAAPETAEEPSREGRPNV